jgi:hypothetical protein
MVEQYFIKEKGGNGGDSYNMGGGIGEAADNIEMSF